MTIRTITPLVVVLLLCLGGCAITGGEVSEPVPASDPLSVFARAAVVIAVAIEIMGIAVIAKGAVTASLAFVRDWFGALEALGACYDHRILMGQAILLGLEYLVAADIIRTVAVRPTFQNVGVLGAIVGIRTFLSFALEIEIEGRLPWRSAND